MNRKLLFLCAVLSAVTVSVRAEAPAAPKWTTGVNLGLNMTRGNSRTLATSGGILSERKGDANEFTLGAEGNYGRNEVEENGDKKEKTNVQNAKGYAKYRHLFTARDYGYLNGELSQDKIADITYRLIVGPGLGRYFIKSDKNTLGAEAGVAYIKDKVGGEEGDRIALRVAQNYEWKITDTSKIWESVEYLPTADDLDNYLINAEIGAEAAMNTHLSLRIVAKDNYNNRPAAGKDENDFALTAGVGYKF